MSSRHSHRVVSPRWFALVRSVASFSPGGIVALNCAGECHRVILTGWYQLVNARVTGSGTEMVCFKLNAPDGLRAGRKLEAAPEVVAALPLGSFVSYNRLSGGTLAGQLF